jgi:hypothetical protein
VEVRPGMANLQAAVSHGGIGGAEMIRHRQREAAPTRAALADLNCTWWIGLVGA